MGNLSIGVFALLILGFGATAYGKMNVVPELQYLIDPEGELTLEQVLEQDQGWQTSSKFSLSLGFTSDRVWLRFQLPEQPQSITKLLEVANHKVSQVEVFVVQPEGDGFSVLQYFEMGGSVPIEERAYPHRHLVFPLSIPANQKVWVYSRVENDYSMKLPLRLLGQKEFHDYDTDRVIFHGLYFGAVLIMALYNLCIYFFVKDRSYATYVIFIVLYAMIVAVDKGLATQYLWPAHPHYDFQAYVTLIAIGAASSVLFTINFLSLDTHAPRYTLGFKWLIAFWMLVFVWALISPSLWVLLTEMIVLIPGGLALFIAGVLSWRRGIAAAPYYTISWFMVIAGVVIYSSNLLGLLPVSIVTEYALQVGNILEAALLSLGLAYRIKVLDEEKQSAYALSKAKSEFLATMSHEIRTPMNGILGMAQLLKDTKLSQQQGGYLSTILGSGQTLLTVLNDILDYSKIEAGKLDIEDISFNVRRLVDETAGVFAVKATEKGVFYNVYVAPLVPIKINGDPTRVRQILTNFLSNAFKFTSEGKVIINVVREQENNALRFEVKDSGIGISQDKLAAVFEEFTQADSSTSRQFGGTGLGLPISKRLIEMMGGDIGVQSVQGEGSVFWFSLPIKGEVPFDRVPDDQLHQDVKNYRFLQISPDKLFEGQMQAYSEVWGFHFSAYGSIHKAIKHVSPIDDAYDYVFVDQYCEDFSYEAISRELLAMGWCKGAQLILLMKPGSDRMAFEQMKPEPWIEEYPVSITRVQLRFLGRQGVRLSAQQKGDRGQNFSAMRVLLVEDNPVNAKVALAFLEKVGIVAKSVDSGEEALELVCHERREFDLILMDCEMPGIDGYTTTRHIRDWEIMHGREPVSICALSAHAMDAHRSKCMDVGMNDMLTKPINFDQLKEKIEQVYKRTLLEAS